MLTPALYDLKKYFLRKCSAAKWLTVVGIAFIIIEMMDFSYGTYFTGSWICCYFMGFFLPDLMECIPHKLLKVFPVVMIVLNLPMTWVWYWLRYIVQPCLDTGSVKYILCELGINWSRSFAALAILLAIWQIGKFLLRMGKTFLTQILSFSDRFSFDIYIAHMIYVKGVLSLIGVTGSYLTDVLFVLAASIFSGIILNCICLFIRKRCVLGRNL